MEERFAYIRTKTAIYDRAKVLQDSETILQVEFFAGGKRKEEAIHKASIIEMLYYQD